MTSNIRWRRAALIVPAFALLFGTAVACGGDDDDAGGNDRPAATSPASTNSEVPDGAAVVDQKSLKFSPTKLNVKAGDTVYFTNSETAVHNVSVDGDDVTGTMRKGAVASYTFETPGEYKLTCQFHPQMKATVVVES